MSAYDLAAVVEQDDGSVVIQLMEACDPAEDPHGDGARLAEEVRAEEAIIR